MPRNKYQIPAILLAALCATAAHSGSATVTPLTQTDPPDFTPVQVRAANTVVIAFASRAEMATLASAQPGSPQALAAIRSILARAGVRLNGSDVQGAVYALLAQSRN